MRLEVRLPLHPLACPRARVAQPKGRKAFAYYPANYKSWKKLAENKLDELTSGQLSEPIGVPFEIERLEFVAPRPQTTKLPFPKPDLDNYEKSVLDALTGAGVITDDWLCWRLREKLKRWTNPGESPHVLIVIRTED